MAGWSGSTVRATRLAILLGSTSLAGVLSLLPAFAQTTAPATGVFQRSIAFAILPQSLSSGIVAFSRTAGVDLVFDGSVPRDARTQGVSGTFTVREGINQLLAGTGLSARFSGARTVQIYDPSKPVAAGVLPAGATPLDTIDVQVAGNPNSTMTLMPEYAGGQVATGGTVGMLGNRSIMDTPFNQTSYTSKTLQDQQARSLADVVGNDPSVQVALGAGFENDQFYIRGFKLVSNDIGFNGLYGLLPTYIVPPDYAERVEVLKGPSNLLNGMPPGGSIGGSINVIAKRATDEPINQLTTSYMSKSHFGEHVDIGRRFGQDNAFGVRFNGSYRNGDVAIDRERVEFGSLALGLDYRSDRVRLSADFAYQADESRGGTRDATLTSNIIGVPAAPNATKNFQPPWGFQTQRDTLGMVQGEFDLTDNITAFAAIGAHQGYLHFRNYVIDRISDLAGNFTTQNYDSKATYQIISAQTGARASFQTGPINHVFNVNVSDVRSTMGLGYSTGANYSGNIYTSPYGPDSYTIDPSVYKGSVTNLPSVGVADTLSILDKRVQFTAGLRRQYVDVDSYAGSMTGTTYVSNGQLGSSYSKSAWSPAFTLLVKPLENISLYANYIQGLQAGTVVGTTYANAGAVLPPYVSKQIETGVKVDWGRLTTTASVFEITQPSTVAAASAGALLPTLALNGEQRNRGIELNAFGKLTDDIRLLGGVTFIDARQVATANHATDGKIAVGVPNVQVKVGAEWDAPFVPGFTLNGHVIYASKQYNDTANNQQLPSWTRVDLGARYTFTGPLGKPVTIRFNVENFLNKSYWSQSTTGWLQLGAPRTYLLSTTMNF